MNETSSITFAVNQKQQNSNTTGSQQ